jgi:putative membrane protein insertion efficiency factor
VTVFFVWLIRAYRAALAPFFGPTCRFLPSCSRYAEEALAVHGFWRGAGLAFYRICRCQPLARGGLDPVPAPVGPSDNAARARG